MKQRKRGARRIFAKTMAVLMVLSAVDVSGWGVMDAKAGATTVGEVPQSLYITGNDGSIGSIISNGKFQDDGVSGNTDTIYQGTNWYYDSEKNQLVLEDASVQYITVKDGDLTVLLSGENTVSGNVTSSSSAGKYTLKLKSDNSGSLTVGTRISDGSISGSGQQMNLEITDTTIKAPEIVCKGSMKIENSHVIVSGGDSANYAINADSNITITNSYVEAKIGKNDFAISSSENGLVVSNSQIMACNSGAEEVRVMEGGSFSDTVVTKQYGNNVTKSVIYGTASLIEKLTIPNDGTIVFMQGASITNQDLLVVEDGANILVNGYMIEDIEASGDTHTHNTDGLVTREWKDTDTHVQKTACADCPIGYVTKETESHSFGDNGFCACNNAYQPAVAVKYDMDGDGSEDAVYEIGNAGQLYWFAGLVNGTLSGVEQNTSANAVLTADIVVNKNVLKSDGTLNEGTFKEWTPIGTDDTSSNVYTGTFDGQKYTISGLHFNQEAECIGLFGANSGKISNVGILDSYFYGKRRVGGVSGYNCNGTITNCYNAGSVSGTGNYVGGVSGDNSQGIITNCYNVGSVSGTEDYVGGVSGENYRGTITNCYNVGSVSGTEYYVGG